MQQAVLTQLLLPLTVVLVEAQFNVGVVQDQILSKLPISQEGQLMLDPSSFTKEVRQCQQNCGDGYYQCFMSCEDSNHITQPTKAFFQAKTKHKPKWSSYLLNVLSFGFMGDNDNGLDKAEKVYYELPYVGDENGMNDNKCLKNCTKLFRTCYRHCVCRTAKDEVKCMSDIVSSSPPNIPQRGDTDGDYVAKFDYVTQTKPKKDYQFDWSKLS